MLFPTLIRWTILILNKSEEVLPTKQSNTPISKMQGNFLRSRKEIPIDCPWKKRKIFQFQLLQKWQLSNSNTKVCFNDEILKLQMHQYECKGSDHTINEQMKNSKPKQMIAEN